MTIIKKQGTKNMPITVDATIPPIIPVPIEGRLAAPAPVLMASGRTPSMKASEVMMIGRKRRCEAFTAACISGTPFWCSSSANSTIKMAFFADRPISVTSATWK